MMVIGDLFRSEENCVVDGGGLFGSKAAVGHRGRSARIDCCLYRSEAVLNRRHRWLEMMIMMKKSGVNNVCRYGPLDK